MELKIPNNFQTAGSAALPKLGSATLSGLGANNNDEGSFHGVPRVSGYEYFLQLWEEAESQVAYDAAKASNDVAIPLDEILAEFDYDG